MNQADKTELPVLAIDLGGTKIMAAVFSGNGRMLDKEQCPTLAEEGTASVVDRLFSVADRLLLRNAMEKSQLGTACIAAAGAVDTGRGVITISPNLPGWIDIPLADMVRERFSTTVFMINDASAAALGEHRYGAARGSKHAVMLTLGTGIGGGIIVDGELYLGVSGSAGEIGHMVIDINGPECTCGNRGCLEQFASGTAIARDASSRLNSGEESVLLEMAGNEVRNITAGMVAEAARRGDALAQDIFHKAGTNLGIGLVNIVNIFNPEVIVVGGGMANEGGLIIGPAERVMRDGAFQLASGAVRLVPAELGNESGVYGAAAYAFSRTRGQA